MRSLAVLLLCSACVGTIDSPSSSASSPSGSGPSSSSPGTPGSPLSPGSPGYISNPGGTGGGTEPTTPAPWQIPAAPGACATFAAPTIRLLSNAEIEHTLAATFGAATALGAVLPAEERVQNFTANAAREVGQLWVDTMDQGSGVTAASVAPAINSALGCASGETEEACVRRTLARLGRSLYRRPLASSELDDLWVLYGAGRLNDTVAAGLQLALQGMIGAPSFAYRTELGLDAYELAAALSYGLTGAPPDAVLAALADSGALIDPATREAQVDRLLQSSAGKAQLGRFANEWFSLENVSELSRNPADYPLLTAPARLAVGSETATFVSEVMTGATPTAKTLFGADFTFADDTLAQYYGLPDRPGATPAKVALTATPRRGILGQAAFQMAFSHENQTSPIKRGVAIRTRALCLPPPPPPPNVVASLGSPDDATTTRQRFEAHVSNPSCAACHSFIDPPGFALEGFDPIGQVRTQEHGMPVDTTGTMSASGDANGAFTGEADFAALIAQSQQAADCVLTQVMTFELGRVPDATADACLIQAVRHRALTASGDTTEGFKALVASDAFMKRAAP